MRDSLVINTLDVPGGGRIGLCACPGRSDARFGTRDLTADLQDIAEWRADKIVTLVERREFVPLGVPDLDRLALGAGHLWHHFPVPDMQPPDALGRRRWGLLVQGLSRDLAAGQSVLLHCAAGLGRTGTVAAACLIALGDTPERAIASVRAVRPGAIESESQVAFLSDLERVLPVL